MLRRTMLFVVVLLLVFFTSLIASAQDELSYGDSADSEITDKEFEVEFTFEGSEGDVVVITLAPEDDFDGLNEPMLLLLDEEGDDLATVESSYNTISLIYELPGDGTFTVIATRSDGRSGEAVGPFTLSLDLAQELFVDEPITDSTTNESAKYYVIRPSGSFGVLYTYESGDFHPEVTANIIGEPFYSSTNLEELARVDGDGLDQAIFTVSTSEDIVIVRVGMSDFGFAFDTEEVEFTVEHVSFE